MSKEYIVSGPLELIQELQDSFNNGVVFEHNGKLLHMLVEHEVERFNGLKVEIFSNEHPPPHFRVKYQSSTANFQISDCTRLNGSGEILKYEKNILKWWKENKQALIDCWNSMRPSDCPVGLYKESSA